MKPPENEEVRIQSGPWPYYGAKTSQAIRQFNSGKLLRKIAQFGSTSPIRVTETAGKWPTDGHGKPYITRYFLGMRNLAPRRTRVGG